MVPCAVTEQALLAAPHAYHGRVVRVAADWRAGLELSSFAGAWLGTDLPHDGRYRVEATGTWRCEPGASYGHFGVWSAQLDAFRVVVLDAYDRESNCYRIPFGKSRFLHSGRRIVIERKGKEDVYRVRVDGEPVPMHYGRIRRADDGSFTPIVRPGPADWIALGPALRATSMLKTEGLHRLATTGHEEQGAVVTDWRDEGRMERVELRFADRYTSVEVRWFEFPDAPGKKPLDPYTPPEKIVRRIRRALRLRELNAPVEALVDENAVVQIWPKLAPVHRAAIDWPPEVKRVLVDLALEGANDLPVLSEDI